MRVWVRLLCLAAVAVVFCAPLFAGLGRTDQENDEAIYSYAVESILETGDWLNPRIAPTTDAVFLEKPPLKFWIVALPIRLGLLPDNGFGLRFWDAVFGSLAFLYVFAIGRRMAGWFCGVVGLVILYSFDSLIFAHGLRGNNMEAPLMLAYAGAVYHFARWAETDDARGGWRHALAVGLYFFLGFMTKFVAALFLPMVLGAATLELTSARDKALREWRTWVVVLGVVAVLVAPWFIYQMLQPGRGLWAVMLGEHVYKRFNAWLDPNHVKPWYHYFVDLFDQMTAAGTAWVIIAGAVLIHARVLRERWPEGTLTLYWFWLPFVLMSLGTSKLRHYTYPFLPPVALAGGYFMASVANVIDDMAAGRPPAWMSRIAQKIRVDRLVAGGRAALPRMTAAVSPRSGDAIRVLRVVLLVAAIGYLGLAAIALVYPGRLELAGLLIVRHPSVWRPALIAMVLGLLAGRGRSTARIAVPLVLMALLPIAWYRTTLNRVMFEHHPLLTSRNCVQEVQDDERKAGRPVLNVYVYLPGHTYQHPYFFYYRQLGWDRQEGLADEQLMAMLDTPGLQRPIMMPRDQYLAAHAAHDGPTAPLRSLVQVEDIVILMPGPYAKCGI